MNGTVWHDYTSTFDGDQTWADWYRVNASRHATFSRLAGELVKESRDANEGRRCDYCDRRGARYEVEHTSFLVCLRCLNSGNPSQSPTVGELTAEAVEDRTALRSTLEPLMTQLEKQALYGIRTRESMVSQEQRDSDPSATHPERFTPQVQLERESDGVDTGLAEWSNRYRAVRAERSAARRQNERRQKRLTQKRLEHRAELEAVMVRALLVVRAYEHGRTLEELLKAKLVPRRVVDLSLLLFHAHGFQVAALSLATGYQPHQVRDSLQRAREYIAA